MVILTTLKNYHANRRVSSPNNTIFFYRYKFEYHRGFFNICWEAVNPGTRARSRSWHTIPQSQLHDCRPIKKRRNMKERSSRHEFHPLENPINCFSRKLKTGPPGPASLQEGKFIPRSSQTQPLGDRHTPPSNAREADRPIYTWHHRSSA
jgi:hypothetical protein